MRRAFDAAAVALERDQELNAQYLVLAEHPDGSGRRLEIQRALEADDQSRALGQNTYSLVTEDQATHYGGVVSWRIDGSALELSFDDSATHTLGARELRVTLPVSELTAVEDALRSLLL
jgi:hypothetical protein